jgi:hypothetical protein
MHSRVLSCCRDACRLTFVSSKRRKINQIIAQRLMKKSFIQLLNTTEIVNANITGLDLIGV